MPRRATYSPTTQLNNRRVYFVAFGFAFLGIALLSRLFYIQIIEHGRYAVLAEDQYGLTESIYATRGTIKSSDGFDLATTQPAYTITADPQQVLDVDGTALKIANILKPTPMPSIIDSEGASIATPIPSTTPTPTPLPSVTPVDTNVQLADIKSKLSNKNLMNVELAKKVSQSLAEQINALGLPGIYSKTEQQRYYPEGSLASQILGFVGRDDKGSDQGYYGIEGYFDRDLRGSDGRIALQKDPSGKAIPVGDYQSKPVEDGADITLTINRSLQYLIEQKLQEAVEKYGAEQGSVILQEPSTGKILAMANYPTYDPAKWSDPEVQSNLLFKNSAIADAYEPGSVIKSFTVATGIDLGLFTPTTTYQSGPYKVGDHTITNSNSRYYGTATVTEMLDHSDNTGAAQFGLKIGRDKFLDSLHKIGLDRPTGITLEGEGQSIIPDPSDWLPVTLATASFGQGISTTALQLTNMMATIANDGVQMKPTIIESVTKNGQTTVVQPQVVSRVFKSATSKTMAGMLEEVVERGEFHRLALQGYKIAGKTSTAQIPIAGGYDPNNVITTFMGYAPADNPKFVMLTKLVKPTIHNSAETVVPMWMNMAKDIFTFYGMAPAPSPTP